ncbi:type II toxin-antitoxin system VapC family toxin [Mongoliitalea daihaiensis]|uniref:type II toxin-antitoxin system VapC family toxin n=1 Tax=Mongoliitalea daihaiensis TaxID=2782006 RepID=UPI001F3F4DC1|nr:type II toxin-antitoxin system VapC family toxin [Mongoliitalea daihaiensis]
MNGNSLFVDTNILLYFLKFDSQIVEMISDKNLILSVISEIELLSFPDLGKLEEDLINEFLDNCVVFDLSLDIKGLAIRLRKKYKLKLPDAIIAASAINLNIPLLTSDKGLERLKN